MPVWYTTVSIVGLAVVTVVTRGFFLISDREIELPAWAVQGLRYAPIAALVSQGKERQLRGHLGGALNQGFTPEELTEAIVHLIAYVGFPGGLTALEILNEVIGSRK